jgi:hypothetical protein
MQYSVPPRLMEVQYLKKMKYFVIEIGSPELLDLPSQCKARRSIANHE